MFREGEDICFSFKQGWEFSNLFFALLLKIAQIKERPWAIRSGCSWQKSVSNSLPTTNDLLEKIPKNCIFCMFLTVSPLFCQRATVSNLLTLLFWSEQPERFAQINKRIALLLFCSQKTRSKNRRVNSQPWL